jgi:hypothetical protein
MMPVTLRIIWHKILLDVGIMTTSEEEGHGHCRKSDYAA